LIGLLIVPVEQAPLLDWIFWSGAVLFILFAVLAVRLQWAKYVLVSIGPLLIILLAVSGHWAGVRDFINWICRPERLLICTVILLVLGLYFYRQWTLPRFAGPLFLITFAIYMLCAFDPDFFKIISKPDNIPITITIFSISFFTWLTLRRMAINDSRLEKGDFPAEGHSDDRVLVWPDLVYIELIIIVICTVVLIGWSILLRAPLEAPANPHLAPNPAKAPWYFLGLQELLIYFDPWIAGVALPCLMVFGLCALPYLDKNPKGNGYYTIWFYCIMAIPDHCGDISPWPQLAAVWTV